VPLTLGLQGASGVAWQSVAESDIPGLVVEDVERFGRNPAPVAIRTVRGVGCMITANSPECG